MSDQSFIVISGTAPDTVMVTSDLWIMAHSSSAAGQTPVLTEAGQPAPGIKTPASEASSVGGSLLQLQYKYKDGKNKINF